MAEIIVPGAGPSPCRIALVGERPGKTEARDGIPFVGQAGKETDRYLFRAGLDRFGVYVTNLIKTYLPDDPDPTAAEVEEWAPVLEDELAGVGAEIIGTLGRYATRYFLGDVDMQVVHGLAFHEGGRIIVPIYHPAAGLWNSDMQPFIADDFMRFGDYCAGRLTPRPTPWDLCPEPKYCELGDGDLERIGDILNSLRIAQDFSGIDSKGVIAIDTEGWKDDPWCLSYSTSPGTGYVIRRHSQRALGVFADLLLELDPLVVFHNSLHDIPVLHELGVHARRYTDTMILAYLLRLEPQGLKPLSLRHHGMVMSDYPDIVRDASNSLAMDYLIRASVETWPPAVEVVELKGGEARVHKPQGLNRRIDSILKAVMDRDDPASKSFGKPRVDIWDRWRKISDELKAPALNALGDMPQATLDDIPVSTAIAYAARDADATLRLLPVLLERIKALGLERVAEIDLGVVPMIERMQSVGMAVDPEYFVRFSGELQDMCFRAEHQVAQLVGRSINLDSPAQVAKLLFDTPTDKDGCRSCGLGIPVVKLTKGKTRASSDDEVLETVKDAHPAVPIIQIHREASHLKTSFADVLPTFLGADGRLHTTLRITRVHSGRLSATKPNLLNQPVRTELGMRIREGFVAPAGRQLASWDLDQIEMKVMAHESQDVEFLRVFREGRDVHLATAAKMFGKPEADIDKMTERYPAKSVGFGTIYGITKYGLHTQMKLAGLDFTEDDCDKFICEWLAVYPGVGVFMEAKRTEARRYGYVSDMFGRVRYLPGVHSNIRRVREEAYRQAVNHPIQAGAQEIIKIAMVEIWGLLVGELWPAGLVVEPLLQVHDELVFEIPDEEGMFELLDALIRPLMEADVLDVPVTASGGVGRTWAALK